MSEWVSVRDRLPEEGESVMVYFKRSNAYFTHSFVSNADYSGGGWDIILQYAQRERGEVTVTHWMPLPPPPKEKD